MHKQVIIGMRVEREHLGTFNKLKSYYNKHKRFPSNSFLTRAIALDHLREDKKYYTKLRKANL